MTKEKESGRALRARVFHRDEPCERRDAPRKGARRPPERRRTPRRAREPRKGRGTPWCCRKPFCLCFSFFRIEGGGGRTVRCVCSLNVPVKGRIMGSAVFTKNKSRRRDYDARGVCVRRLRARPPLSLRLQTFRARPPLIQHDVVLLLASGGRGQPDQPKRQRQVRN